MRGKRVKWIRKVVISKHPKILPMIIERVGEKRASEMNYGHVIDHCKKMWSAHVPGVEEWSIYKEKEGTA
jgi:hypothetical protein